jgi:alpha-L-fucosidase
MKYTVLTSRRHDGFALFDDSGSSFTATKSAAHRDFVAEYVNSIRKAGLHVGLYYSPLDWRFPGFFFPDLYQANAVEMREQYHRQLNELASHYSGSFTWQDDQAVGNLRKLQPSIILNDRTDAPADFLSREGDQAMGNFDNRHPWELCTTLTTGAWGYQPNAKVKPLNDVIRLLVGAAGRDGNLLLNVGPRPDGQIVPEQAERPRSWRLAESIRSKHLRHPRRSVSAGRLRRLNLSRQNGLSPHPPSHGQDTLASSSSD